MVHSSEHWMSDFYESIKDKALNEICWPATHDSGMSFVNDDLWSVGVNDCNVVTQNKGIDDQLKAGARVFDFRPFMWISKRGGDLYLGHFNYDPASGACGEDMASALKAVKSFIDREGNEKEVVFLHFSHCYKWDTGMFEIDKMVLDPFSYDDIESLRREIEGFIGDVMYVSTDEKLNVGTLSLKDVVESGRRVIVTIEDKNFSSDPKGGFFTIQTPRYGYIHDQGKCVTYSDSVNVKAFYQYAGTDDLKDMESKERRMLEKYSACYKSGDGIFSGFSWTLTRVDWAFGKCIEKLAEEANNAFTGKIEDYLKDGVITKEIKPSMVWFDYYSDSCLEPLIKLNTL